MWSNKQRSSFSPEKQAASPLGLEAGLREAVPPSGPGGGKDPRDIMPSHALKVSSLESTEQGGITYLMLHRLCAEGKIPGVFTVMNGLDG